MGVGATSPELWSIYGHMRQGCAADQEETQFFDSNLIIKSDHEVRLRRYWYQCKAKFRAESFYDGPDAIGGQFRT